MSKEEWVDLAVPVAEQKAVAVALLEAAGDNHADVRSVTGGFCVPRTIAVAAGLIQDEAPAKAPAKSGGKAADAAS